MNDLIVTWGSFSAHVPPWVLLLLTPAISALWQHHVGSSSRPVPLDPNPQRPMLAAHRISAPESGSNINEIKSTQNS